MTHAGPLEATAANLAREVASKQADGRALQRRWAARQAELVVLAQVLKHHLYEPCCPADDAASRQYSMQSILWDHMH